MVADHQLKQHNDTGAIFNPAHISAVMGLSPLETQARLSHKGLVRSGSGTRVMRVLETGNGIARINVRGDMYLNGVVMGVRLSKD